MRSLVAAARWWITRAGGVAVVLLAGNARAALSAAQATYPESYSARRATIGFTRVARRAGTKHENAAITVSSAVTAM